MTLAEVAVSVAIGGMIFGGVLTGYMQSATRSQWAAYNLAGHSLAMQRLECARATKWDTQAWPPVDGLVAANFPVTTAVLDAPMAGTNLVMATSTVFITSISTDPPLKMIRVETVWPFRNGKTFTNITATYRSPDQ